MTRKMFFDKKDHWDLITYYVIYIKDDVKMIKFVAGTDREDKGKGYLSWIGIFYDGSCEMPLEDFLLWDVYYQLDKLTKGKKRIVEMEPQICFAKSNQWIKGEGKGSVFKRLLDLDMDVPCDCYYE